MAGHPALTALFAHRAATTQAVAGGHALYEALDSSDALYLVIHGAFAVFRDIQGSRAMLGIVRPGEIVGEAAVLAATPRTATVIALRDSEVRVLPANLFFEQAHRQPDVMREVARLLIQRTRSGGALRRYEPPKVIAVATLSLAVDAVGIAQALADAMRSQGLKVVVVLADNVSQPPSWWAELERTHDAVLCVISTDDGAWGEVCHRQADRMLVIGHLDDAPPADCGLYVTAPLHSARLVDLLLVHTTERPQGTKRWLSAVRPARHHHLAQGSSIARVARQLRGHGVAVALSGGGARAFAHIGAIRALRRAGIEIDAVGGTSMGAIVAAGVAADWSDQEMAERMRAAFVTTNPLDDIALPLVAMTRGAKVDKLLRDHFGSWTIEDLPLPFFCVSADLGSGTHVVHREGDLASALRASISLPGVLPPVTLGDQVLVDGGTLLNLPTGLLRAAHDGTIVAVDVSRSQGLRPMDVARPRPLSRWLSSGAWRRGPPLVSILMRSATIAAEPELRAAREAADLYVMPEVGDIEIRNWRAFDRAIEAGDEAMSQALDALDRPLDMLRRDREAPAADPM